MVIPTTGVRGRSAARAWTRCGRSCAASARRRRIPTTSSSRRRQGEVSAESGARSRARRTASSLRRGGAVHFSHKLNVARPSRAARPDPAERRTSSHGSDWMSAMLEYSQQPTSAPSARSCSIRRAPQTSGSCSAWAAARGKRSTSTRGVYGYASSAISVRNYSAVTAGCMMTRRDAFERRRRLRRAARCGLHDVEYCCGPPRRLSDRVHAVCDALSPRVGELRPAPQTRKAGADEVALGRRDGERSYYHPALTRDFADYRIRV